MTTAIKNLTKAVTKLVDEVQTSSLDKTFAFVKSHVADEAAFTTAFEEFRKTLKAESTEYVLGTSDKKAATVEKKKRTPSEYNIYIGAKIKELKAADSSIDGKDLMKRAIAAWKESKAASA